ncbi:MAG TPA: hypothetical protein VFV21_01105 [Arenimonas sp.]|nr:hypothetical protein [Arenimonas sp.]
MITALVFAALTGQAAAQELYCEGVTFFQSEEVRISTVIRWDAETLAVTLETAVGEARGTMQETPKIYMGSLATESGVTYWFNLDRFTGALIYGQQQVDGRMATAEFTGTCAKRDRLF